MKKKIFAIAYLVTIMAALVCLIACAPPDPIVGKWEISPDNNALNTDLYTFEAEFKNNGECVIKTFLRADNSLKRSEPYSWTYDSASGSYIITSVHSPENKKRLTLKKSDTYENLTDEKGTVKYYRKIKD